VSEIGRRGEASRQAESNRLLACGLLSRLNELLTVDARFVRRSGIISTRTLSSQRAAISRCARPIIIR